MNRLTTITLTALLLAPLAAPHLNPTMKTKRLILLALLCGSCVMELKTRPPKEFVWHTVTAQEDLGTIALRYYDDPKAGFIYLQEVNRDRLVRGQPQPGQAAPGTRIMVPSKAEFQL